MALAWVYIRRFVGSCLLLAELRILSTVLWTLLGMAWLGLLGGPLRRFQEAVLGRYAEQFAVTELREAAGYPGRFVQGGPLAVRLALAQWQAHRRATHLIGGLERLLARLWWIPSRILRLGHQGKQSCGESDVLP